MGIGIPGFVKDGVNAVKDVGAGAVNKAKDVGGGAVDLAKKGVSTAKDVGGAALDKGKDAVQFSGEILEKGAKGALDVGKDFGAGVVQWGKGTVGTVVGIASHPLETAKALGSLASNPILNPVAAPIRGAAAALQGKNPLDVYKDGAQQLKGIGEGLASDWKTTYKEHGVAGVLGLAAPDIATAVLTGGGSAAGKVGAEAAGKAVTREVAQSAATTTAREVVEDAATSSVKKQIAKDVGKEFVPGPEDVADSGRKERENGKPHQNWLEAFVDNFGF